MKKLLTFLISLVVLTTGFAQNSDYADRMEHIFGNIDKTKVTTGYLKEFGIRFNEVEIYNGMINTNNFVDKTQWQSLYSSLYSMRVGTVAQNMTSPGTVFNNHKIQQEATTDILLTAQYYRYQQYKANAYTNGDVIVVNDQIFDVAGRNPYEIKRAFSVTPLKKVVKGNSFSFKLPSNLIYGGNPTSIEVDFDNGQGYQTVTPDVVKNITYTAGGQKELKFKFSYKSLVLYSHSKIYVRYTPPSGVIQARFNGAGTDVIFNNHPITGAPWQGSTATGLVTVEVAPGHNQLTKPLIVVEGFDPDGSFDYDSFIDGIGPGGINIPLGGGLTLNQAIEDEDYDLVFVNFANGTDYIQRNAYMVKAVIDWVNNQKVGNEKNVVLGMSMGGLVARYALRHMELNNEIHDTKLYISHDAPHQGANIPLAAQAFVRHIIGEEVNIPVFFSVFNIDVMDMGEILPGDLQEGLEMLQSPAAQQMLIYQLQGTGSGVSIDNSTLHNSFVTEYANMGYPQQGGIRNIAISNGSECGTPLGFAPNATLAYVNETISLPGWSQIVMALYHAFAINPGKFLSTIFATDGDIKARFTMKALPNQQSKQIYKGEVFIRKTILFFIEVHEHLIDEKTLNSSSSMLPLDNAGGGVYDIESFVPLPSEFEDFVNETRFNFIPTYSSLDIGGGNQVINYTDLTKVYTPLTPPVAPKNIPFNNFYTNPTTSQGHIQFTLNNGNWLMDELSGDEAFYSCASACGQLELSINGSGDLCNSGTYNINNLTSSSDVNVQWSILPTTAATLSQTGNSVTLTKSPSYNGNITLSASVNTKCDDIIVQKQMWVGKPRLLGAMLDNGQYLAYGSATNEVCKYEQIKTNISFGGTNYVSWSMISSSHTTLWSQQGDNLSFYLWAVNHTATFRITLNNGCGTFTRDFTFKAKDCSGGGNDPCEPIMSISQNPVDTEIEIINIPAPCDDPPTTGREAEQSTVTLYDLKGNALLTKSPAEGTIKVDDLKSGHYILVITNGIESKSHHIIIN